MEKKTATKVECQTCKKGLNGSQQGMLVFGFYILFASIVSPKHAKNLSLK